MTKLSARLVLLKSLNWRPFTTKTKNKG